ncbi:MAG TPA: cell division protein ZapB [Vicinamibacterales bacterium]|nr:cell division protein ZapB [Vicinamibacterales bacterium]
MAKTATTVDLQPIDRLEEKVKQLVQLVDRLRAENTRVSDDNVRLMREVEGLKARMSDADSASVEVASLREERDVVRARVAEMLAQIDRLAL